MPRHGRCLPRACAAASRWTRRPDPSTRGGSVPMATTELQTFLGVWDAEAQKTAALLRALPAGRRHGPRDVRSEPRRDGALAEPGGRVAYRQSIKLASLLLGSTGAVGIFVGRHGRIRADSRDSARSCRFATSSGSYLLGRSPDRNGRGWTDFADLCLTTWLRRQRKGKVATQREFFKSVRGLPAIIAVRPQRTGERHYTSPVLRISHAPLAYRAVALAAIISVGSTGTGLQIGRAH